MTSVYSHVIFINYIQNNSEKGLFSKRRWDGDLGWFNSFYRTCHMNVVNYLIYHFLGPAWKTWTGVKRSNILIDNVN